MKMGEIIIALSIRQCWNRSEGGSL